MEFVLAVEVPYLPQSDLPIQASKTYLYSSVGAQLMQQAIVRPELKRNNSRQPALHCTVTARRSAACMIPRAHAYNVNCKPHS